ncbi:hypothetical protein TI03_02290 [Achromatium sp. WMS1]|nr:hypothetical protein TI03_02290 [Achromatium sp. WMS1]
MRISILANTTLLLVLLIAQQILFPTEARSWSPYGMDTGASAQYVARSGVRTAYENLRRHGISWQVIRDEKLPRMLDRVILGLQDRYSHRVLIDTYIPAFTEAFYDEVDKINRENRRGCIQPQTLSLYAEVIIASCKLYLSIDVSLGVQRITNSVGCS